MTPEQQLNFTLAAVVIAGLSFGISLLSLGWNIYRDIILKPKLKLRFSLSTIVRPTFSEHTDSLVLSATNFGPGHINCRMIQLRSSPLWRRLLRKPKHAVMINDYENPLSAKLPAKLEVGESIDLLIRYRQDCFLGEEYTQIGLSDSFGRIHWASASDVAKARKKYKKDFEGKNA